MQNKAFFFGDYEGFRQDKKATAFSTLPTAAQDAGILQRRHPRSRGPASSIRPARRFR